MYTRSKSEDFLLRIEVKTAVFSGLIPMQKCGLESVEIYLDDHGVDGLATANGEVNLKGAGIIAYVLQQHEGISLAEDDRAAAEKVGTFTAGFLVRFTEVVYEDGREGVTLT